MDIHLIPGLGSDHRIFEKLLPNAPDRHAHDWPQMAEGSTLRHFAEALCERIDKSRPHALIGMSMGGMVVQEMASISDPAHVIIISSWKGPHEMPPPIRVLRGKHPERLLNKRFLQHSLPLVRWQMGVEEPESAALFDSFLAVHTIEQLKVQINACLEWEGPVFPVRDLLHLHGDRDRLMPAEYISGAQVVKGGTHFMVYDLGSHISGLIHTVLEGKGFN
jgi:pimeloyl-ACP methyl ester carboxylesterase